MNKDEQEKAAEEFADVMAEALELVMTYASNKGFCPGCFINAFAATILAYEQSSRFDHVDGKRRIKAVFNEDDDEDTIGETAGNA